MEQPVIFEKKESVGWLTLNRPKQRNALSLDLMEDMQKKLDMIAEDPEVRVLVIKAEGPAFCAGHNIKEMAGDYDIHHFRKIFSVCSRMMQTLHQMPQPVIARVHGIATAAGCQLVASCDLAIAESGATFATPGVKIGLFCSTPMIPLSRVIGRRRALEMLLTGRFVSAQEALEFGLVNKVTEPDKLAEETQAWANQLAQSSLFTLAFGKRAFYKQTDLSEGAAYDYAQEIMVLNALAEDAQEGMKAFIEKRKPEWKDR